MAEWYYYDENGIKVGPVAGHVIGSLAQSGKITRETVIENAQGRRAKAGQINGILFPETPPNKTITPTGAAAPPVPTGAPPKQTVTNVSAVTEPPTSQTPHADIFAIKQEAEPIRPPKPMTAQKSEATQPPVLPKPKKKKTVEKKRSPMEFVGHGVRGFIKLLLSLPALIRLIFSQNANDPQKAKKAKRIRYGLVTVLTLYLVWPLLLSTLGMYGPKHSKKLLINLPIGSEISEEEKNIISKLDEPFALTITETFSSEKDVDFLKKLQNLEEICLIDDGDDSTFSQIKKITNLKKLKVYNCSDVTDSGLIHLAKMPKLQEVVIAPCNKITDAGIVTLAKIPKLRSLLLDDGFDDLSVSQLAKKKTLQSLSLIEPFPHVEITHLVKMKNLRSLEIFDGHFTDSELRQLSKLTDLEHLLISGEFTDVGLAYLEKMTKLQSLIIIEGPNITAASFENLAKLPRLHTFGLMGCEKISDADLSLLAEFKNLQTLLLSGDDPLNDIGLANLSELPKLRSLFITGNGKFSDEGLDHLSEIKKLRSLTLFVNNEKFTDAGIAHLASMNQLQDLSFGFPYQIAADLECNGLNFLKMMPPGKASDIIKSNSNITDAGLSQLTEITSLKSLNIGKWENITDAGLIFLSEMPNLQLVGFERNNEISQKGIKQLCEAPKLQRVIIGNEGIVFNPKNFPIPTE